MNEARQVPEPDLETLRVALEHARAWQRLHAEQRLRAIDFFLVAAAFLVAGYVASFGTNPGLAAAAGAAGALVSVIFNRMELRAKELVKRGEAALAPLEGMLASRIGVPELRLVERAERPTRRLTSYAKVIGLLHWCSIVGFAVGTLIALRKVLLPVPW
jgi:hypothetical protein